MPSLRGEPYPPPVFYVATEVTYLRTCSVCSYPPRTRDSINRCLANGMTYTAVAKKFNRANRPISRSAIMRHSKHVLTPSPEGHRPRGGTPMMIPPGKSAVEQVQTLIEWHNEMAEQANDESLKKLNLGVTAWVKVQSRGGSHDRDLSYAIEEIGYAKVNGKWGIALRIRSGDEQQYPNEECIEEWPFNESARAMRLRAIDKIPELIKVLSQAASAVTMELQGKLADAQAVAGAVKEAAGGARKVLMPAVPTTGARQVISPAAPNPFATPPPGRKALEVKR